MKSQYSQSIQSFGENIWIIEGPNVRDMGILFPTRMTIIKLLDGSLWINSPVPVMFKTLKEITELGLVQYLVAATPRHVWRLSTWHTLFPEAQLWVSKNSPFTLKGDNLSHYGILDETPVRAWQADLEQHVFKGNPFIEEVLFFHRNSRTLILDDLIQAHIPREGHLISNAILKLEGVASSAGGVGLDFKLTFFRRKLARQSLEEVLSWDFDRLIIAHGSCVEKDAKLYVQKAFSWLTS